MDDVRWLSTAEAAERLGIIPRTLYRLIDDGAIPAYRFGRVIRLQATEVDAFIQASRIAPGSLGHLRTGAQVPGPGTAGDDPAGAPPTPAEASQPVGQGELGHRDQGDVGGGTAVDRAEHEDVAPDGADLTGETGAVATDDQHPGPVA